MKNRWYVATLIVRCRVGNQISDFIVDEQIRVLRAPDADAAYEKAIALGELEKTHYLNADGESVYWEFMGLADLEELDGTIHDGAEIRSRFLNHDDPSSLTSPKDKLFVYLCLETQRKIRISNESEASPDQAT